MKRDLFNWKPELIDIDIYKKMRESEISEKHREIVGDVGKMKAECRRNIEELSENYRYNIINLSPVDFSQK